MKNILKLLSLFSSGSDYFTSYSDDYHDSFKNHLTTLKSLSSYNDSLIVCGTEVPDDFEFLITRNNTDSTHFSGQAVDYS